MNQTRREFLAVGAVAPFALYGFVHPFKKDGPHPVKQEWQRWALRTKEWLESSLCVLNPPDYRIEKFVVWPDILSMGHTDIDIDLRIHDLETGIIHKRSLEFVSETLLPPVGEIDMQDIVFLVPAHHMFVAEKCVQSNNASFKLKNVVFG